MRRLVPTRIFSFTTITGRILGTVLSVKGEPVAGAYVRKLTTLGGGYGTGSEHSNVHLWYHGTIDWRDPASDTEATITGTQRTNWWVAYESQGTLAGFYYSLIGGGDRLSLDQPVGSAPAVIRDGYNQHWDLGAGLSADPTDRTLLPSNSGNWPNLIKLNRTDTNDVVQGQAAVRQILLSMGAAHQQHGDGEFLPR